MHKMISESSPTIDLNQQIAELHTRQPLGDARRQGVS